MAMQPNERKAALVLAGVRQSHIARALGVSQPYVSDVIAGNRRSDRIEQAVAKAIGKKPRDVFPPRVRTASSVAA